MKTKIIHLDDYDGNNKLTNLELSNFGGEPLQDCRLAPTVLVDGEDHEPEVPARVEAGDDEDWSGTGDVGEGHGGVHINHLQHEALF